MTEYERLIELIDGAERTYTELPCHYTTNQPHIAKLPYIVDYLLASGEILVLPCKVGDKVYFAHRFECRITEHKVENLYMGKRGMSIRVENLANPLKPYEIGKTVFLTKEEAEQALKGGAE